MHHSKPCIIVFSDVLRCLHLNRLLVPSRWSQKWTNLPSKFFERANWFLAVYIDVMISSNEPRAIGGLGQKFVQSEVTAGASRRECKILDDV